VLVPDGQSAREAKHAHTRTHTHNQTHTSTHTHMTIHCPRVEIFKSQILRKQHHRARGGSKINLRWHTEEVYFFEHLTRMHIDREAPEALRNVNLHLHTYTKDLKHKRLHVQIKKSKQNVFCSITRNITCCLCSTSICMNFRNWPTENLASIWLMKPRQPSKVLAIKLPSSPPPVRPLTTFSAFPFDCSNKASSS